MIFDRAFVGGGGCDVQVSAVVGAFVGGAPDGVV